MGPAIVHLGPIDFGLVIAFILNLVGPHAQCTKILGVGHDAVAPPGGFHVVPWKYPMNGGSKWTPSKKLGVHGATCKIVTTTLRHLSIPSLL